MIIDPEPINAPQGEGIAVQSEPAKDSGHLAAAEPTVRPNGENRLIADAEEVADRQFIDDLIAANRFKSFLAGTGVDVPPDVSRGIGELVSTFAHDMRQYEAHTEEQPRARWWSSSKRK